MIEKFLSYIKEDIDNSRNYIIFDIGSRDLEQSIEFYHAFPNSTIYAFECNPNTINICKEKIKNYNRIILIEGAVSNYDGVTTFYPINQELTRTTWTDGNPGASSLFKSNGSYDAETYIQDEIQINCHRLDTIISKYNISNVDIIWMDLQGAELLALDSLGKYLDTVKYIHTEVSHKPIYHGQVLFDEFNSFLSNHNFVIKNSLSKKGWQEDAIYENITYLDRYEQKIYSQNREDGITLEILKRIKINKGFYVEFGTENGNECNTRILRENGWSGLLMDYSYQDKKINLYKEFITRENIISLFNKYDVPKKFDLLSIDIDYNDFYVLYEIIQCYEINVIILEYNASFLPTEDAVVIYKNNGFWDGSNYFGASLLAFQKLLNLHGYSLIYTEKNGVNAFFVNNKYADLFIHVDNTKKLYNSPKYGSGPRGGHPASTNNVYITSKNILNT